MNPITDNQQMRNNYPYTRSSKFSTNNQSSVQRTVTKEDNGTSQNRYENNIAAYYNNKKNLF